MTEQKLKKVCVVVLGDIERSPRMKYHSLSLANSGYTVDIIGYEDTKINKTIKEHPNIHMHSLVAYGSSPFKFLIRPQVPRSIHYIFKTIWQIFTLFCALAIKRADYVLVQNPPAIPTLFCCAIYCFIVRAKYIIDWHNYAYSIMMLSHKKNNFFVRVTKFVEWYFGSSANYNLCVTEAMKNDMKTNWDIQATVLYDRPSNIFRPISLTEKHEFLSRFAEQYEMFKGSDDNETAFTYVDTKGDVNLKKDRPALLISSTSWTEDEDFSILLKGLEKYEESINNGNPHKLPKAICVITGQGPLKDRYLEVINKMEMKHIQVVCPWLEVEDYPLLLASADLGLCLHTSSSGLDLPMKVVDMFGCCLPVCAIDFECLHELVKNGENSYTFTNSSELTDHLITWFDNYPNNEHQQEIEDKFKKELHKFQILRWEENWKRNALPLFK